MSDVALAPAPAPTTVAAVAPAPPPSLVTPSPTVLGTPPPAPAFAPVAAADLKLPETIRADDPEIGEFLTIANDQALSHKDRVQKMIDFYSGKATKGAERLTNEWNTLNQQWVDQIKADPTIGGDKLPATTQVVAKAIDSLGPQAAKEFRAALNITGAGNHPAIVRGLHALGLKLPIREGSPVPGSPGGGQRDLAKTFFPNSGDMT